MITGKNYIGTVLSAQGSVTYRTHNPKVNKALDPNFYEATPEEIDSACNLAQLAFKEFQTTTNQERALFLEAIVSEITSHQEALLQRYQEESGLPEGRAQGELGRTTDQIQQFADLIRGDEWNRPVKSGANNELRQLYIPIGPVAVFGAANFPFAFSTAGGDTASALAAGCPVVVKSHPMHSGTGELMAYCITQAASKTKMPKGVFSNLNSAGIAVGEQLVQHPAIKAVGFTGSRNGGTALQQLVSQRKEPIPVFAEMGSINPVVITSKALVSRKNEIAKALADSINLGAGQFCTKPGLIIGVKSQEFKEFRKELEASIAAANPQTMLHSKIFKAFTENAKTLSGQPSTQLVSDNKSDVEANRGQAILAITEGHAFLSNPALHEEVFGPFALLVECNDQGELLEVIHRLDGQLTATLFAEQEEYPHLKEVVAGLQQKVGRIILNGVPTGVAVAEAMTHGGPYPASTDSRFTAVGTQSIKRWLRPFTFQNFPTELLPQELH